MTTFHKVLNASLPALRLECFHPDTLTSLKTLRRADPEQPVIGVQPTYMRDARNGRHATLLGEIKTWVQGEDGPEKSRQKDLSALSASAVGLAFLHLSDDRHLEGLVMNIFWDLPAENIRWGLLCLPEGIICLKGVAELGLNFEDDASFQAMINENVILIANKTGSAHEEVAALNVLQKTLAGVLVDEAWQRSLRAPNQRRPAPNITITA